MAKKEQSITRGNPIIKCCALSLASLVVLIATTIIVLILIAVHIKNPTMTLNGFKITKLELGKNNGMAPKYRGNLSLLADISVKNPSFASFRYSNITSTFYYHGIVIGEGRVPQGVAKARRTIRVNTSVVIMIDRVMSVPNLGAELGSGVVTLGSYSRTPGKIKVFGFIKKHAVVKMNCTITFNVSSKAILRQDCKKKVKF